MFGKELLKVDLFVIINFFFMSVYLFMMKVLVYSVVKVFINNFMMWMVVYFVEIGLWVNVIVSGFFLIK